MLREDELLGTRYCLLIFANSRRVKGGDIGRFEKVRDFFSLTSGVYECSAQARFSRRLLPP